MLYQFNEGVMQLPGGLKDRTMHMLVPFGAGVGFSFIIGHDELEPDETFDDFLKRQLGEIAKQVTKFQETSRMQTRLGQEKTAIPGVRLLYQFKQRTQMVYQRQDVFPMPDKKAILSFTASAGAPFDAAQKKLLDDMIASFRPRAAI